MSAFFERRWLVPGQNLKLPAFYVTVGKSWADFLEPYRDWLRTAVPLRTDTPAWVYGKPWHFHTLFANGYPLNVQQNGSRSSARTKQAIDSFMEVCCREEAQAVFWLQNWWKSCERIRGPWSFDHFQGDFRESLPVVKEALEYIHRQGAKRWCMSMSPPSESIPTCLKRPAIFL